MWRLLINWSFNITGLLPRMSQKRVSRKNRRKQRKQQRKSKEKQRLLLIEIYTLYCNSKLNLVDIIFCIVFLAISLYHVYKGIFTCIHLILHYTNFQHCHDYSDFKYVFRWIYSTIIEHHKYIHIISSFYHDHVYTSYLHT